MLDYALKNICKRWGRSLLTMIGVTLMMTIVIVTTGIVNYQLRTVNRHAAASAGKIHVQSNLAGDTYPANGIDLSERIADEILNRTDIQPHISGKVIYLPQRPSPYPSEPPQILLVGVERGKEEAFTGSVGNDIQPIAGVEYFSQAQVPYPVVLGFKATEYYAQTLQRKLALGDTLTILDHPFTVIGLLNSSADMVVNNALIIPLDLAQTLLDKSGYISATILVPERVDGKAGIVAGIQQLYPHTQVVTDEHIQRNLVGGIKLFEEMIIAISVVVVLGAALLIMTVMLITVRERTREIGVLRALGASKLVIVLSVLWEVFLLSALGSTLGGVISGLVLRFAMLENIFNLGHILSYLPLAVVLTLLAGALPALQISRIQPIESLRYE